MTNGATSDPAEHLSGVPLTPDEFKNLRDCLLSNQWHEVKRGMDQVKAWKEADKRLPLKVEATCFLLQALLRDPDNTPCSQSIEALGTMFSHGELVSAYAFAIVRAVSSIVDPVRNRYSTFNMDIIAVSEGFSLFCIELRHAIVHQELPTLEKLQQGAKDCMAYLSNRFWHESQESPQPPERTVEEELKYFFSIIESVQRKNTRKSLRRVGGRWLQDSSSEEEECSENENMDSQSKGKRVKNSVKSLESKKHLMSSRASIVALGNKSSASMANVLLEKFSPLDHPAGLDELLELCPRVHFQLLTQFVERSVRGEQSRKDWFPWLTVGERSTARLSCADHQSYVAHLIRCCHPATPTYVLPKAGATTIEDMLAWVLTSAVQRGFLMESDSEDIRVLANRMLNFSEPVELDENEDMNEDHEMEDPGFIPLTVPDKRIDTGRIGVKDIEASEEREQKIRKLFAEGDCHSKKDVEGKVETKEMAKGTARGKEIAGDREVLLRPVSTPVEEHPSRNHPALSESRRVFLGPIPASFANNPSTPTVGHGMHFGHVQSFFESYPCRPPPPLGGQGVGIGGRASCFEMCTSKQSSALVIPTAPEKAKLKFPGNMLYTNVGVVAEAYCRGIPSDCTTIGFNVVWQQPQRKAALVQLCYSTGKKGQLKYDCILVHIIHSGVPEALKLLLAKPGIKKVGLNVAINARKLELDYGMKVDGCVDIVTEATMRAIPGRASGPPYLKTLKKLCQTLLKQDIGRSKLQDGNWEVLALSRPQKMLAATTAYAFLRCHEALLALPQIEFPNEPALWLPHIGVSGDVGYVPELPVVYHLNQRDEQVYNKFMGIPCMPKHSLRDLFRSVKANGSMLRHSLAHAILSGRGYDWNRVGIKDEMLIFLGTRLLKLLFAEDPKPEEPAIQCQEWCCAGHCKGVDRPKKQKVVVDVAMLEHGIPESAMGCVIGQSPEEKLDEIVDRIRWKLGDGVMHCSAVDFHMVLKQRKIKPKEISEGMETTVEVGEIRLALAHLGRLVLG